MSGIPGGFGSNSITSPQASPSNISCRMCGDNCVSSNNGEVGYELEMIQIIAMTIVGAIGFVIGAAITGCMMMLSFKNNGGNIRKSKKQNEKVFPIDRNFDSSTKKESTVESHTNAIVQESDEAAAAHNQQLKKRETIASKSTQSRLAIRKAQLEMKIKRGGAIEKIPLFSCLTAEARTVLLKRMKLKIFEDDEEICCEGDEAQHFYIVAHVEDGGSIKVSGKSGSNFSGDEEEVELTALGVFDYFGEAALLDGGLRTATATSVGRIEVLSLTRNTWNELVEQGILGPDIASVLTAKALEQSEERKGRGGVGDVDVDQDDEIMEIQDY